MATSTIRASHAFIVPGLAGLALAVSGCGATPKDTPGSRLALTAAALDLPGVDYVCYDLQVEGPTGTVWSAGTPGVSWLDDDGDTLCSWQYGNGRGGDIAYVAPCDADDGDGDGEADNTITLWFDGLYVDPDGDHDPDEDEDIGDWQDPCRDGCRVTRTCRENADTEVKLDFTVVRAAKQGFFDVAVEFSDIFCSAKLDCQPSLLTDPETGRRGPTAVIGFACTAGHGADGQVQPTHLYLDDYRVECKGPPAHTYYIEPALGPGNLGGQDPGLFEVATYRGSEQLPGVDKCYWNTALGLDVETLADEGVLGPDCTVYGRGTAADHALSGGETPDDTVYPVVEWNVPLTDATGALLCESHPLNGDPKGVGTGYTKVGGERFACSLECATGEVKCDGRLVCDQTPLGLAQPVTVSQSGGGDGDSTVTIAFEGRRHGFALDAGYSLSTCCPDNCCTEGK